MTENLFNRNRVEYTPEEIAEAKVERETKPISEDFWISFLRSMAWVWLVASCISGIVIWSEFESATLGISVMFQGAVSCSFLLVIALIAQRLGQILEALKKHD